MSLTRKRQNRRSILNGPLIYVHKSVISNLLEKCKRFFFANKRNADRLYLRHIVPSGTEASSQLSEFVEDVDSLIGGIGDDDVIVDAGTNGSGTVETTRLFTRTTVS